MEYSKKNDCPKPSVDIKGYILNSEKEEIRDNVKIQAILDY